MAGTNQSSSLCWWILAPTSIDIGVLLSFLYQIIGSFFSFGLIKQERTSISYADETKITRSVCSSHMSWKGKKRKQRLWEIHPFLHAILTFKCINHKMYQFILYMSFNSFITKGMILEDWKIYIQIQSCHLLSVCPWESYLASLIPSLFI